MKKTGLAGLLGFVVLPILAGNTWIGPASAQVATDSVLQACESLDRSLEFGRKELGRLEKSQKNDSVTATAMSVSFLVMGEVNCPGEFDLAAPVSLVEAVAAAGGPTINGSLRKIRIDRSGKTVLEADLYNFLLPGGSGSEFHLAEGDVVSVQAGGPLIKVSGRASRTGIFEMMPGEMTLEKVMRFAGGFSEPFSACKVQIFRKIGGYRRVFLAMQLERTEKIPAVTLLDGDEIRVSECLMAPEEIFLAGHCHKAKVAYSEGLKLSEILGDKVLKNDTALDYGEILRKTSGSSYEEVLSFVPGQLLGGDNKTDVSLRPGDKVVLFSKKFLSENPVVIVEGMVARPGRLVVDADTDIKKVIVMAGGIRSTKTGLALELARRELVDGKLQYSRLEINLAAALQGDPRHNIRLKPFDSLTVYCP